MEIKSAPYRFASTYVGGSCVEGLTCRSTERGGKTGPDSGVGGGRCNGTTRVEEGGGGGAADLCLE